MTFKNSLAATGYIFSLFGGGYLTYEYLQDKTIGDLIQRLGSPYTTETEFKEAYSLHKEDPQFKEKINNGATVDEKQGVKLLWNWCDKNFKLPLTEENIEKVFKLTQKYCTPLGRPYQINGSSLNLKKIKHQIINRGIEKGGQLFVTFYDGSKELGRRKQYSYCWNISKKDWESSTDEKDCRKKNGEDT